MGKDGAEVLAETLPSCEVTDLQLQSDLDETEEDHGSFFRVGFFRVGWLVGWLEVFFSGGWLSE